MRTREELVEVLRDLGTDETQHSGSTLLEHLVATAEIVERWGGSEDAQAAALFHSVYGTEHFHDAPLEGAAADRALVRDLIGERAERLAWIFCAMERASLYRAAARGAPYAVALRTGGQPFGVPVTEEELRDLFVIVWANAVEQAPRAPRALVSRRGIERAAAFLPEQAVREARGFL